MTKSAFFSVFVRADVIALMKMVLAIMFAALSGVAFAQSPRCMPGGTCCINSTCGTLEQFKRNATIVCLQADAIENKSLPQSIELAGRCTAAEIMARRVEETQQANAKEHQQALDTQRKLREMGAPLPLQSQSSQSANAGMPTQEAVQWALQVSAQAITECRTKRLRGELATYAASAQCSNKIMVGAFNEARYKYMDLIQTFAERRLELASMADRGQLTEQQEQLEINKALATIQAIERQRDGVAR